LCSFSESLILRDFWISLISFSLTPALSSEGVLWTKERVLSSAFSPTLSYSFSRSLFFSRVSKKLRAKAGRTMVAMCGCP
jgi:hypothetical protein